MVLRLLGCSATDPVAGKQYSSQKKRNTLFHDCGLSQIKSEYIGDAARPGLEGEEYAL
jgi:hypothetical protein